MKKGIEVLVFLFIITTLIYACKQNENNNNSTTTKTSEARKLDSIASKKGEVDFKLVIVKPTSARYNKIYELVQKDTTLRDFIRAMNNRIEFPGDVAIVVEECGEDNAFYSADSSKISICYEFLEHMMSIQDKNLKPEEKLLNATAFTFLHEMGHALVDKLNLPITGKEENAVDELAMVVLMSDTSDVTYYAAIEGAMQFYNDALNEDLHSFPFYDTHAPSLERYNDMLVLIVGAYPEGTKDLVGEGPDQLHPDRAEGAEDEYAKKLDSWRRLLGTAWKE